MRTLLLAALVLSTVAAPLAVADPTDPECLASPQDDPTACLPQRSEDDEVRAWGVVPRFGSG